MEFLIFSRSQQPGSIFVYRKNSDGREYIGQIAVISETKSIFIPRDFDTVTFTEAEMFTLSRAMLFSENLPETGDHYILPEIVKLSANFAPVSETDEHFVQAN